MRIRVRVAVIECQARRTGRRPFRCARHPDLEGVPSSDLEKFGDDLLSWLAMLFVPAATGLMTAFDQLTTDWWRIAAAILISTLLGLATTGWIMERLSKTLAAETETEHDA
ncbi:CidA/LrgA family protein [Burkholderia territorii]|uniref:CidA/LrgA family protein n=1 Tax=Burkholderia territorii TaxID=1503055 RepID=UPI001F178D84|nr:CidA/LrgA family protein [Burkholderia territorii]